MEKVIMNVARTDTGYCCDCDLLPGWVVAHGSDFDEFKKYVQESIDFYIDCARNQQTASHAGREDSVRPASVSKGFTDGHCLISTTPAPDREPNAPR